MSPLQIWNYLGLGRIRKRSFLELGGLNNYYTRVIIIECKNKRFAANIILLFVEARRAETNKWFITNERSELK